MVFFYIEIDSIFLHYVLFRLLLNLVSKFIMHFVLLNLTDFLYQFLQPILKDYHNFSIEQCLDRLILKFNYYFTNK